MSDGMLKRLEPVFIPKKRVQKGKQCFKNKTEIANSPKPNNEVQNVVQTPKKLQPKVKSQPPRKLIRRELFPQKEDEKIRNVLEIVDEQNKECKEDQFIFPGGNKSQENPCKMTEGQDDTKSKTDGFKKPKSLPKISKRRKEKQRSINKSVLEIIRKTQKSIQKIRNQGLSRNTLTDVSKESNQENKAGLKKAKTNLNVQVSICIPNSGIQKSECTVQQSGSVEEEDIIGYKHVGINSFQNIQDLL
ncbi:uncharacterized protein LOC116307768 [Actinia tenebrosa]|uniref:Uncharacterized protein LOC116307768 n=1 Tax=Actinia tenebrosa TaxID=6105 RepID=A0A6P8J812_ACTTE|nr:uncharacterized protein LOC116307768 [Actinia tenebrosa]